MKIAAVEPYSPLRGSVFPGDELVSLNGQPVLDVLDFQYRLTDEEVVLRFAGENGKEKEFRFDSVSVGELGLTFEEDKVRRCRCHCIFCFVHQQPKGMRRSLYIKDDDYRLSFTHGNFITLSNLTEEDTTRIIRQRLSPLYVSVHATDDALRRSMLGNEKLAPILPQLRRFAENGITLHTQVVLCPGVNDGKQLEKTIDDLSALSPAVETLAIVPVGLTKYRERLTALRTYTSEEAQAILSFVEKRQREFLKKMGTRFVWAADEFYILAKREFPSRSSYEEMAQFENGVGMAREFITQFNRRRRALKKEMTRRKLLFITGYSAQPFWRRHILPYLKEKLHMQISILPIRNEFWGESVTVSGLLTGKDILTQAAPKASEFDVVILPPNCLNTDKLFLDDMSLAHFEQSLGKRVVVGKYDLVATLKEVAA